ncbi:MAG: hypothetical protein ABW360_19240 [Phenylobacterium sp.]
MPRILTTCQSTGEPVVTGYRTTDFDLSELAQPMSFRCNRCNQVHAWTKETAWVEVAPARAAAA